VAEAIGSCFPKGLPSAESVILPLFNDGVKFV
jgi:hypothetical protein